MGLTPAHSKILWGLAAGRCMAPQCKRTLPGGLTSARPFHIGEEAHILPDGDQGPRHEEKTGADNTDRLENYLLLCPTCHTEVDKASKEYPSELLRGWRASHIQWVSAQLEASITRVTFEELRLVTEAIADTVSSEGTGLRLTPPEEKMERNELTQRLRRSISLSLSQAAQVREFLMEFEEVIPDFPNRLISGFRAEYFLARSRGLAGDELYSHLATHESSDLALQTAQSMVVAYLFHTCDLFES